MKQLPLFQRVLFVDWHGVLSRDPFWKSILCSNTHPLRRQLEAKLSEVFSHQATTHNWMRGVISSQNIISEMRIWTDRRFRQDFLERRLYIDCARMSVNVELFEVLRKFKPGVVVVLATDNMDCFAHTFDRARARRRRTTAREKYLSSWANVCDEIVCSSSVGSLKSEDPVGFFGPLLSEYGLWFPNAMLIDDRGDNCEAFRRQGGSTIQWKMGTNQVEDIVLTLSDWLQTTPAPDGEEVCVAARSSP